MPVEYTQSGRIKRVQADSILETKLVINEMQSRRQDYEAQKRQLAIDTSQLRANYRVVTSNHKGPLPPMLARKRLEEAMQPLVLRKLEVERMIDHIDQCIWQLDGYLSTIMGNGLQQHDFRLHYQPIIALSTGTICGFEALVRWQRTQRGFTFPAEFIPVAEETGIIVNLDRWVLTEACRQLRDWQDQFPQHRDLTISVNLSNPHLSQSDLADHIAEVLEHTGLSPRHLKLEIPESAIIDNLESLKPNLERLRALDVHLAIDDFGAGNATLDDIFQLPFTDIVLDRALISELNNEEGREAIEAISFLAHNQNLGMVAKGVETPEQLDILRTMSGQYVQGYLFSKPVDSAAAAQLLTDGKQW